METILLKILAAIILLGITAILNGQRITRKEAKEGRRDLHEKINPVLDIIIELTTFHKVNFPDQKIETKIKR